MLKIKVIDKITPSAKSLLLFKDVKDISIVNGYTKVIEKTNIKQVFPIVYSFNSIIIYEYPKEYSNKPFYLLNKHQSYSYDDLKQMISEMI